MLADVDGQSRKAASGAIRTHRLTAATRGALLRLLEDLFSGTLGPIQFSERWSRLDLVPAEGLPHLKWLVETYFELLASPREPVSHLDVRWSDHLASPQQALSLLAVYLGELLPRVRPSNLPIPAGSRVLDGIDLPIPHE